MAVIIPSTLDEAKEQLNALGRLLTAKEWERAAIVYAFTRDGGQGEYQQNVRTDILTVPAFSRLGISGLKSHNSVRMYRDAWQWAVDNGYAGEIHPGQEIELPTVEWSEWREWRIRQERNRAIRLAGGDEHALALTELDWPCDEDEDEDEDDRPEMGVETPYQRWRAQDVVAAIRNDPRIAQQIAADAEARAAVARANFEYDGDAEEMANAADPQRAEMRSDVDSMHYREKMREWRRLGDELAAWTDRAELSESETRASIADAQIVQNAARLIESKLSGQFDRDLSALLSEGE